MLAHRPLAAQPTLSSEALLQTAKSRGAKLVPSGVIAGGCALPQESTCISSPEKKSKGGASLKEKAQETKAQETNNEATLMQRSTQCPTPSAPTKVAREGRGAVLAAKGDHTAMDSHTHTHRTESATRTRLCSPHAMSEASPHKHHPVAAGGHCAAVRAAEKSTEEQRAAADTDTDTPTVHTPLSARSTSLSTTADSPLHPHAVAALVSDMCARGEGEAAYPLFRRWLTECPPSAAAGPAVHVLYGSYEALVRMKACRHMDKAWELFADLMDRVQQERPPCPPPRSLFALVLEGCVRSQQPDRVEEAARHMLALQVPHDAHTFTQLVKACTYANPVRVTRALCVFEEAVACGMSTAPMCHALLEALAKGGDAQQVAMLCVHMSQQGVMSLERSAVCLTRLLSAKGRRARLAFDAAELLSKQHGFRPSMWVHSALVLLLVKTRSLNKAVSVAAALTRDPQQAADRALFDVLLRGCMDRGQGELERAAHVLLSAYGLEEPPVCGGAADCELIPVKAAVGVSPELLEEFFDRLCATLSCERSKTLMARVRALVDHLHHTALPQAARQQHAPCSPPATDASCQPAASAQDANACPPQQHEQERFAFALLAEAEAAATADRQAPAACGVRVCETDMVQRIVGAVARLFGSA